MSSFESEVNNWHRRDPWRTKRSLFTGVCCCCLRAEKKLSNFLQKLHGVPNCRFKSSHIGLSSFSFAVFYQSCRNVGLRDSMSCSLRLSVKKRSVEMFMWQVWFFFPPLNKSHESPAARTKAADSQRNVVQARKINLLAPNSSSDYSRNNKFYSRIVFYWASESSFSETRGQESREKQLKRPTFSVQCACHSEQHGPDKHQTSRRLHPVATRRL